MPSANTMTALSPKSFASNDFYFLKYAKTMLRVLPLCLLLMFLMTQTANKSGKLPQKVAKSNIKNFYAPKRYLVR